MKAAAAILAVPSETLPGWLLRAAEMTWDRWVRFQPVDGLGEDKLHPTLYFVEGLLIGFGTSGDREYLRLAADAWHVILSSAAFARCQRSDFIAQALRAGCLLSGPRSLAPASEDRLPALSERLAAFQGPDGAVHFDRAVDGPLQHANAWCSMFAAQAWWAFRHLHEKTAADTLLRFLV